MHVTILAYGSRGDVQPYISLAQAFGQRGHQVRLAAPAVFEALATSYGCHFHPLPGDPTALMQRASLEAGDSYWRMIKVVLEHAMPLAVEMQRAVGEACRGTDVIIHSLLTAVAGHEAARRLGCPDFSALNFAVFSGTSSFPNPGFPQLRLGGLYNRLTHLIFTQTYWQGSRLAYARMRRRDPKLPPLSGWPFSRNSERSVPILYGFSPHVLAKPAEWGADRHVTGYWFLDPPAEWLPPEELTCFLASGPPPIFIGFGSTISADPTGLTRAAIRALAQTGQRGLLLTGWGGLAAKDLPGDVFAVESVPLSWLFPQMAALVHHGGMGTTADGLRAGLPATAVTFVADQPFWGRRLHELGVGPAPISGRSLTADALTRAIEMMIGDEAMRRRAAALGEKVRAENGPQRAVAIVEGYLGLR